jgi:hypothetical protein
MVFIINVSIQVEPCLVLEKQIAQNINLFYIKNMPVAEFLRHLQSTKLTKNAELAPNK